MPSDHGHRTRCSRRIGVFGRWSRWNSVARRVVPVPVNLWIQLVEIMLPGNDHGTNRTRRGSFHGAGSFDDLLGMPGCRNG